MTTSRVPHSISETAAKATTSATMRSNPAERTQRWRTDSGVPQLHSRRRVQHEHRPDWVVGYRRGLIATDVVIVVAVVFTSQSLRFNGSTRVILEGFGSVSYLIVSTLLSALWLAALGINGAWDKAILGAGPSEYARIMRASFFLFGFVAIVSYLTLAEIGSLVLGDRFASGPVRSLRWPMGMAPAAWRNTGGVART